MANEIGVRNTNETDTMYAVLRKKSNRTQVIRVSDGAFVTESAANRALYAIALSISAPGTYYYVGSFPAGVPAGSYAVEPFVQAGANPAATDEAQAPHETYWNGTEITPSEPSGTAFQYLCTDLYAQVANDLGVSNLSTAKQTALRNAGQHALDHAWMHEKWTWRLRRVDVVVSEGTPYFNLPEDFDALGEWDWYRKDSNDEAHRLVAVPRREYWDENACNAAQPVYFRVAWNSADGVYRIEVAPQPDGTYAYPDIPYYASTPLLAFTGEYISTPEMPTEFHRLWYLGWLYYGAKAFGMDERLVGYRQDFEGALAEAKARHDAMFAHTTLMGVQDYYHDLDCLV